MTLTERSPLDEAGCAPHPWMRHADARGAVATPAGIATLIGWPPHSKRCLIEHHGRHLRPLKSTVRPIRCGICHAPASVSLAVRGIRLCDSCARDEATS